MNVCVVEGCDKKLTSRNKTGYCRKHFDSVYRKTDEFRKTSCEVTARYKANHPERVAASKKRERQKHIEAYRQRDKERYERVKGTPERKEQDIRGNANRRARNNLLFVESVDRKIVFERDSGICHICLLPADPNNWELEHIIPQSKGGTHEYANVAVSHPECNDDKWTSIMSSDIERLADALEAYMIFHETLEAVM